MTSFPSQFSLAVALADRTPNNALASIDNTSRAIAHEISASGSDVLVEDDLALVFGRNRLEPLFESSFKTAVQGSSSIRLASLRMLTLEGGAGPTVRRSLKNKAMLSSLAQLSLLVYVYDPEPLTQALRQALESRSDDSPSMIDLPAFDKLRGTLEAMKEQTCAYRWDMILQAIELELTQGSDPVQSQQRLATVLGSRVPSKIVLQSLLDSLTALQIFPDKVVSIKVRHGISTVVAWAHKILGLAVLVLLADGRAQIRFGDGPHQVIIEEVSAGSHINDTVSLLSDAGIDFTLQGPGDDSNRYAPSCPHAVKGYGTAALLYSGVRNTLLQAQLAQFVLAICLSMHRRNMERWISMKQIPKTGSRIVARDKLIEVARVLFDGIQFSSNEAEKTSRNDATIDDGWYECSLPRSLLVQLQQSSFATDHYNIWHREWNSIRVNSLGVVERTEMSPPAPGTQLQAVVYALCRVCWALSALSNFDQSHELPLSLRGCHSPYPGPTQVRAFSGSEIWAILTTFLFAGDSRSKFDEDKTSVISNNGWSIVMDVLDVKGPGDVESTLLAVQGVPTRLKERRRFVVDTFDRVIVDSRPISAKDKFETLSEAGGRCQLNGTLHARSISAQTNIQRLSIEMTQHITTSYEAYGGRDGTTLMVGPRKMQEMCWDAVQIPSCECRSKSSEEFVQLPEGSSAFTGYFLRELGETRQIHTGAWDPNATVHISATAGSLAGAWLTFCASQDWVWTGWKGQDLQIVTYTRSSNCCLACAVKTAAQDRPGYPKILIT